MSFKEALQGAYTKLGQENEKIVFVTSDVGKSFNGDRFKDIYGDRYVNVGIAEQNAAGVSAGLAGMGYTVFYGAYAMFAAGRAWEIIRNYICYPGADVKIIATHGGLNVGEDGATHQATEDMAIMRALPNMRVFVVEQPGEVYAALQYVSSFSGPAYVRLPRADAGEVAGSGKWESGKGVHLRTGRDAYIIAVGLMVKSAWQAAQELEKDGIDCGVINMRSVKPIDRELVRLAAQSGRIVTAEEHNKYGGLFSAVAEELAQGGGRVSVTPVCVQDCFAESGSAAAVMEKYGLDAGSIVKAVKRAMGRGGDR